MEQIRQIPYGVSDFRSVRESNLYYVDKTMYIKALEDQARTLIFIRPRRFGKSLFINMMRLYYDKLEAENFEKLFGGLDIGRNPTGRQNRFFVISLDFSQVNVCAGDTWAEKFAAYISSCIDEGCTMGMFIRSVSDRISLG